MTEAEDSQLASTAASDRGPIIGALLNHGLLVSTSETHPFRIRMNAVQRRADADFKMVASFAWPAASAHAQPECTSVFPLPELQRSVPNVRAKAGPETVDLEAACGLCWSTRCPRRPVRAEILFVAESNPRGFPHRARF
jgi:hypothetical protein